MFVHQHQMVMVTYRSSLSNRPLLIHYYYYYYYFITHFSCCRTRDTISCQRRGALGHRFFFRFFYSSVNLFYLELRLRTALGLRPTPWAYEPVQNHGRPTGVLHQRVLRVHRWSRLSQLRQLEVSLPCPPFFVPCFWPSLSPLILRVQFN